MGFHWDSTGDCGDLDCVWAQKNRQQFYFFFHCCLFEFSFGCSKIFDFLALGAVFFVELYGGFRASSLRLLSLVLRMGGFAAF